ncbi:hypothetical protein HO173_009566 [Letharia columbiana]|uniref:Uncharacterized protein n=1 Tax=Letharia columbiana TaxID=112416 RepID=A0A8H6FP90_9LECA|nr:uncharacterized protein HO173_009566 [Letharia columbiana]KAF6232183.1 hypothetical protein HO173_009566 [Letharia columbiana]
MAYATTREFSPEDLVRTRPGSRLAVLKNVLERRNVSVGIFNCKGQGTYQCGWGDCSTNFTDQNPFTIILRDDQKSASTSLPSKGSNTLAVGLGIGLSLGDMLAGIAVASIPSISPIEDGGISDLPQKH